MANSVSNYDLSKYSVLAVDDIPLNLLLLKKMLGQFNFKINTASGGQQALDMIAQEKPALVLLDLMMPGIDGFEVLRRMRANPETAQIPVIIISALNSNDDIVKGFGMGANDFITKPIIMDKLISSVVAQLKRVKIIKEEVL